MKRQQRNPRGECHGCGNPKGWKSEIQKYRAEVNAQRKKEESRRREFLAARDAAYAAHPHGAVTVSVRADGRRVITRGIVCGTGAGGTSKLAEPVPSTGYLHPAPPMSRARWKAVHIDQVFRNLAEERIAVRDCEVYEIKRVF